MQGQPQLYGEFNVSLGYVRLRLKKMQIVLIKQVQPTTTKTIPKKHWTRKERWHHEKYE